MSDAGVRFAARGTPFRNPTALRGSGRAARSAFPHRPSTAGRLGSAKPRDRGGIAALGVLMNTRGLMELIVLNVGLDLKVISPQLFSMMVIMALVTTFMTTPLLHWIHLPEREESDRKQLERQEFVGP